MAVRAFDAQGRGTYADVIRGLDWIVAHHETYGIGVLNHSFSAPASSSYFYDPLNTTRGGSGRPKTVPTTWKASTTATSGTPPRPGPDAFIWTDGLTETMAVNSWVPQE